MKLRHLKIRNFRAITELDWVLGSDIACLIGPGDGCKTTILDAIEYVLYPTWPLNVSDADFPNCQPKGEISIEATVSPIPDALKKNEALQGRYRQWRDGEIQDEPDGTGELAITVRLRVDDTLEPEWTVVVEREIEDLPLRTKARADLGLTRLTADPDAHLGWRRGSYLTRLTSSDKEARQTLAHIYREARRSITDDTFDDLDEVMDAISGAARSYGTGPPAENVGIRMDPTRSGFGTSLLGLHTGDIPATRAGLGTRRLLAAAIQALSVPDGAIMLIDEVETGLEPHRIKGLLQLLRKATASTDTAAQVVSAGARGEGPDGKATPVLLGQVILTSHSPTAICELDATDLHVVRRNADGDVQVQRVSEELQGLVRRQPEALLGRRVVVCEGATEVGVVRTLEGHWAAHFGAGTPFSHRGVVIANGEGSRTSNYALGLAKLGYPTLLLVDGDTELKPSLNDLQEAGVRVVQWDGGKCTEQRLAFDLPAGALKRMIDDVESRLGIEAVRNAVGSRLKDASHDISELQVGSIWGWIESAGEDNLRRAFGDAAGQSGKDQEGWFKRIDHGERLGGIIADHWDGLQDSDLGTKLRAVAEWVYGDFA